MSLRQRIHDGIAALPDQPHGLPRAHTRVNTFAIIVEQFGLRQLQVNRIHQTAHIRTPTAFRNAHESAIARVGHEHLMVDKRIRQDLGHIDTRL